MAAMNAPIAKPKGSKKLKDWESRWIWSSEIMYEDIVCPLDILITENTRLAMPYPMYTSVLSFNRKWK